jgi:steroid 5-alpha reductase family enzyme|tara:strand:- start:303 stop:1166 length:864 start_codon:yes stop_codon:yes gene_type:complete
MGGLMMSKIINIIISIFAFAIAFFIAYATGIDLVMRVVCLAFIIQWAMFIPAYIFQTEKFYDLTGSLTYLSVIWYSLASTPENLNNVANLIIVLLITLWAVRLGSFLFMRIHKDGEDKRFRSIKPSSTQFFMTWTLQGLWVSLCSMCALTAIASESGVVVNALFYLGIGLFILGFSIEVIADKQKTKFRSVPENRNKFITTGLWAKSRHPNFFGEIVLWTGIAVISVSSLEGLQYITLISPVFTYLLLVYVSGVRMLEARADKQWGHEEEYIKYKSTVPTLIFKLGN